MRVSIVQSSASTPPTSVPPPPLYVGWEKGWGERKIIMYGGTAAQFFFQCVDLVIFQACASCIGEPFSVQIGVTVWLGIIQAFN